MLNSAKTRYWCLVRAFLLLPLPAAAQAPSAWPQFTATFDQYVAADGTVGASALILRNGQILARHDFGLAERATARKVDERTLFHWGSITKTLTAISIMQLRDRGVLSLDDHVTRYIPELRKVHDPYNALDSITIRMLLAHTAGFMGSTWPYDQVLPWEPFEPTTWEQLVAMMPYQQLHFRPGSRYAYSNPAFIYLARIIEQLTGDPWESYVQKNIFAPLGLSHSYFRTTPYYLSAHRSHNYYITRDSTVAEGKRLVDNGPDFDPGITTPNGGWNAPLTDLAKYAAFLTNTKANAPAPYDVVLKRSTLEEMWRPVQSMGQLPTDPAAMQQWMGLSFFIYKRGNSTIIGHTGSQAGFRAFLYFNPATSTAIITAFNTTNRATPASALYQQLHTAALNLLW